MISFENVEKSNWKYEALYPYVDFVHRYVYYRKFIVRNTDRIPKDKPVVLICNHQNGLSDALGILFSLKKDGRRPVFVARGDIFKKDFVAKLLRFIRIMPAFRVQDTGKENLGENQAIFDKSADIVAKNGIVCLFPEAGHESCRHLGTFKKGFARIAFRAAERLNFEQPVYIQPLSNHYSNYFKVQGKLVMTVGEPFEFSDLYDLYKENPTRAQKLLADRARQKVKELMLDIEDLSLYDEYDCIRKLYSFHVLKQEGKRPSDFANKLDAEKKIVASLDRLRENDSATFDALMNRTNRYMRCLERLHLRDWVLRRNISSLEFLARLVGVVLVFPFFLLSFLLNVIPYNVPSLVTRKLKDPMLMSSFYFGIGALISYPLWFIILSVIAILTTKLWWSFLVILPLLPLSLVIFLNGKVFIKKFVHLCRKFRFWYHGNPIYKEALSLREKIVKTLKEVVS